MFDPAKARHRKVELERAMVHVAELGPPDAQPVVLVHGWPQNWWCWSRVAPLLAQEYRCVMPDLPGHGWSSAAPHGYEKEALADDLLATLDELGIDRPIYVGHDWGGFLGLLIAIRAPHHLSSLLALSIPHPWPSLRDRLNPLGAMVFAYQLPLVTPLVGQQLMRHGLTRRMLKASDAGFSDEDAELQDSTMGSGVGANATTGLYRSFLLKELAGIALGRYRNARLTVPTRLIVGERDPITRFNSLAGFEPHATDMEVERVPDAGHFLPQEHPELIADRIATAAAQARTSPAATGAR